VLCNRISDAEDDKRNYIGWCGVNKAGVLIRMLVVTMLSDTSVPVFPFESNRRTYTNILT